MTKRERKTAIGLLQRARNHHCVKFGVCSQLQGWQSLSTWLMDVHGIYSGVNKTKMLRTRQAWIDAMIAELQK